MMGLLEKATYWEINDQKSVRPARLRLSGCAIQNKAPSGAPWQLRQVSSTAVLWLIKYILILYTF